MISNNIIKGSRSAYPQAQQELLKKIGCKMPDVLTVMTLLGAINKISDKTICGFQDFEDEYVNNLPVTKSCTSDQLNGVHVAVGLFWDSLFQTSGSETLTCNWEDFKRDSQSVIKRSYDIGVLAMWEPEI